MTTTYKSRIVSSNTDISGKQFTYYGTFSGSLYGTASNAICSSYADIAGYRLTASYENKKLMNVVLNSGSWLNNGDNYKYTYFNSIIKNTSTVTITPNNNSVDTVLVAGILPQTDNYNGFIDLYSKYLPIDNITASFSIITPVKEQQVEITSSWTEPADWIDIDAVNSNEINLLISDEVNKTIQFTISGSADYWVNWGDGTSGSYTNNTVAKHVYTSSTGTPCSDGYEMWAARITSSAAITSYLNSDVCVNSIIKAVLGTENLKYISFSYYVPKLRKAVFAQLMNDLLDLNSLFYRCTELRSVTMPLSANAVIGGSSMFASCTKLETVTMPTSMNSLDSIDAMFADCTSLKSVVMPTTLDNVIVTESDFMEGWHAYANCFYNCHSLTSVTMPQSMNGIEYFALDYMNNYYGLFSGCTSLKNIVLPETMNNLKIFIPSYELWQVLSFFVGPSTAANYGGHFHPESITMPCSMNAYTGNFSDVGGPFALLPSIKTVVFPAQTSNITEARCMFLESCVETVILPELMNSVTTLDQTFTLCQKLKSITLPVSMSALVSFSASFENLSSLETINMPSYAPNVTSSAGMFKNCFKLKSITLPELEMITSSADMFYNCKSLEASPLQGTFNATDVSQLFYGCSKLESITLPEMPFANEMYGMFRNCVNLQSISFPQTLDSASDVSYMFGGCANIKTVTLPTMSSVLYINNMFDNCVSLKSAMFPNSMNSLISAGSAFNACVNLETASLPVSMSSIDTLDNMFSYCRNLQSVTLPESVNTLTNISGTFSECAELRTVILPKTASQVGTAYGMFYNCQNLSSVQNIECLSSGNEGCNFGDAFYKCTNLTQSIVINALLDENFTACGDINNLSKHTSIRLLNTYSTFELGGSPQINISYLSSSFTTESYHRLFLDLPTVTNKYIDITGGTNVPLLSEATKSVATNKGWTILE